MTAITSRRYTNPVPYAGGERYTAPDPFVIRYRDLYYCYATDEHGVRVSTSKNLTEWTFHGICYAESGRKNYWAPSVILINGVFHMYVSNMPESETDTHTEVMRVATSTNPLGPFEKQAELFDTFAIDSQVVYGDDGRMYLLYADNQTQGLSDNRPGTSVMIDRLLTPFQRENDPHPLIEPSMDEEIFARNRFGDGRDWHTVEGATYFTHRDKAFITYSGNAYEHEDYFVGYSVATLPSEPADTHIDRLPWRKQLNNGRFDPLLIRSDLVEGTGHNSIVKGPNGVDDWIVYHGRNASDELYVGTEQRVMRIDPLYYAEGGLDSDGPTAVERDAPYAADTASDFNQGIPDGWITLEGDARTIEDNGRPALENRQGTRFAALSDLRSATQTIAVWVKGAATPLGTRYGLIVRYSDRYNHTDVLVDGGARRLVITDVVDGVGKSTAVALPRDLDLTAWHELEIIRVYQWISVRMDGRHIADAFITGGVGLSGIYALSENVRFSAFRAVDHADLWGPRLTALGHEITVKDELRFDDEAAGGVVPGNIHAAAFTLRHSSEGNRFVFDFAFGSDRAEALICVGDYRILLSTDDICVMRNGEEQPPHAEPVRLRELSAEQRRDGQGRALHTIRLESVRGMLRIHTRGCGWALPLTDSEQVSVTLNGAALTGYTRTSLGRSANIVCSQTVEPAEH